jgi:hypothetical protein
MYWGVEWLGPIFDWTHRGNKERYEGLCVGALGRLVRGSARVLDAVYLVRAGQAGKPKGDQMMDNGYLNAMILADFGGVKYGTIRNEITEQRRAIGAGADSKADPNTNGV